MAVDTFVTALLRALLSIPAIAAVLWGLWTLPIFWCQHSDQYVARQIIAGRHYDLDELLRLKPGLGAIEHSPYCLASATRNAATIRLRIAEETISTAKTSHIDSELSALRNSLIHTLSCSPADSFSWLALFWVNNTQNGFKRENLQYLRLSYALGANEGWIALKRNHISFSIFEELDPDLAEMTIQEFVDLLNTGLYGEVADIFTGPAWRIREKFLPRLTQTPLRNRELFATVLQSRGYDIAIPGVEEPSFNPWR